jgi:hypothetical protein
MEIKVEGSRRNKKFVEAILPSMISQLKLENCRKGLLIRIYDECEDNQGVTLDLTRATGCYLVIIKPTRKLKDIGMTLAHELVHVKQMAKGTLKSLRNGAHLWANKRYSKKTEYLNMPWEIEAFSKQELILRRAIED